QSPEGQGIGFSSSDPTKPATQITISNNEFAGNGRAMYAFNLTNSSFTSNTVSGSTWAASADLRLFEGVSNLTITKNVLTGGAGRALRISNAATGAGNASGVTFEYNSISGYTGPADTISVDPAGYTGTFDASGNYWGTSLGATAASTSNALYQA